MKKLSYLLLRVGLGITFGWIGIKILQAPDSWAAYVQPWAAALAGSSLHTSMIGTGILDIVIGVMLLANMWVWIAAVAGAGHIAIVLVTVGINDVTVRDIGLLGATASLAWQTAPAWVTNLVNRA